MKPTNATLAPHAFFAAPLVRRCLVAAGAALATLVGSAPLFAANATFGATASGGTEETVSAPPPRDEAEPKVKDGFRLRGGFNFLNGGGVLIPSEKLKGGAGGFSARLGAQFNHLLSVYYQNTALGLVLADGGASFGFADYNSFLADVTLLHTIDLAGGPSVDFVAMAGCDKTAACNSGSGVHFGTHGRLAFNIGGLSGNGPRRSGFTIGADVHPVFLDGGPMISATLGLGAEWY